MKKKNFFVILCLFLSLASVMGQERRFTWGALSGGSVTGESFIPINLEADLGYRVAKNFFVVSKFETAAALFEIDGTDKNYINTTAGLFLRYNFYKFSGGLLDVRGGWGSSISKEDWSYNYYDGGVYVHATNNAYKPTIGIGVRYYDSRKDAHKDYTRLYISIGFTYN